MQLVYNNTDLTDEPYGLDVLRVSRPFLGPIRHTLKDFGIEDGGVALGGARGSVVIGVACALQDDDALEARLDALRSVLDARQDKPIVFGKWPDRYYLGKPSGELSIEEEDEGLALFTLKFLCAKPFAYSTTLADLDFVITASPQDLVIDAEDLANATEDVEPVIIVSPASAAASFTLRNLADTTPLSWMRGVQAGHFVKIDCGQHVSYVSSDGSEYTMDFGPKTGPYPTLRRRQENTLRITGLADGTVTVQFRERFRA